MKIAVLGNGAWGTALASHFSHFHQTMLWGRNETLITQMQQTRTNAQYLPDIPLPFTLQLTANLSQALEGAELILCVTPIAGLRTTLQQIKACGYGKTPLLWACKGFEQQTGLLPHQMVAEELLDLSCFGALSGPSFAQELAQGLPCAVCLASWEQEWLESLTSKLNTPVMRLYSNNDLIGTEVGGALKNIMAIATGVADGLGYGMNARAALITRGLAEITRLGKALGAHPQTMMGLSGMGDLILTCTGSLSRNRTVGLLLAQNKDLPTILHELGHVAEGVYTAYEAEKLAHHHQIELPITSTVCQLLSGQTEAQIAIDSLMSRQPRAEGE